MAEPDASPKGKGVLSIKPFRRMWSASLVSSFGDWIGLVAITALAQRVSKGTGEGAVALVLSARLLPGFFLGPLAGVLLDRFDRRRVMLICDIGRALVFAFLPFVDTVIGLFFASLFLEALSIGWSSAKEATVPNLVPTAQLAGANSASVAAAYGTFPLGSLAFSLLAALSAPLGRIGPLHALRVNKESLALWVDGFTFLASFFLVRSVEFPKRERLHVEGAEQNVFRDLRDGWKYIGTNSRVRSVLLGLAAGLFGGGMLVPLGATFATKDLGGGPAGFGALISALGFGVAIRVIGLSVLQARLKPEPMFIGSLFVAAACISLGATASSMTPAVLWVGGLGLCAGGVYVLGFTIIQTNVDDELRGRVFATLYAMIRVVVLASFTVAPIMSRLLGSLASTIGFHVSGVRMALWAAAGIISLAGLGSVLSLRDSMSARERHPTSNATT
ncbi:MAG TPA: MFS transporter [Acidimicrobiales bacterium]|nr:MFS transporter [Acidimicrobiales bacterium]